MKPSKISLKNRIALSYLALTAGLILVIFIVLYLVLYNTVYTHLNDDLDSEASELRHSVIVLNDSLMIANKLEWKEAEHRQIEVNPTFMQIMDNQGNLIQKTANLFDDSLPFMPKQKEKLYYNTGLSNSSIRVLQEPLPDLNGNPAGYIIIAIPLEESEMVLNNLLTVLVISFPFVIIVLFFSTRIIAGRSISPVAGIIKTAETITRENLNERISLPYNKDELFRLAATINSLLERLEDALIREKQFTSDASHELRTPLATIKVNYCITEVDRMTVLVEQLLLLARYDSDRIIPQIVALAPNRIIDNILERSFTEIESKNLTIQNQIQPGIKVSSDASMLEIILGNIISNSIKYSKMVPLLTSAHLWKTGIFQ